MIRFGKGVLAVLGLFGTVLVACGPDYKKLEITGIKAGQLDGEITRSRIAVNEGLIVKAHVVPYDDDNETMHCDVRSRDPNIMEVTAVVNDRDYAFIGKAPGRTQIEFVAGEDVVLIVDAEVLPQPSPP